MRIMALFVAVSWQCINFKMLKIQMLIKHIKVMDKITMYIINLLVRFLYMHMLIIFPSYYKIILSNFSLSKFVSYS